MPNFESSKNLPVFKPSVLIPLWVWLIQKSMTSIIFPPIHAQNIKHSFYGGGLRFFWGGGVEVPICFYGRGNFSDWFRQRSSWTVSEYSSACVSSVGLSAKHATEPYLDNLLNRTRNPSEPYSDKESLLEELWGNCSVSWALEWESTPKTGTFTAWSRTQEGPKLEH